MIRFMMCLFLSFGLFAPALADDNFSVDYSYNLAWSDIEKPLRSIFSESKTDSFVEMLMSYGYYNEALKCISISMYELGTNCYGFALKLKNLEESETLLDQCLNMTFAVFENATAKQSSDTDTEGGDDIYNVSYKFTALNRHGMANTFFAGRLQAYIINKYCKEMKATLSCVPSAKLECDFRDDIQFLERDMNLYCDRKNWQIWENSDGTYEIKLKR